MFCLYILKENHSLDSDEEDANSGLNEADGNSKTVVKENENVLNDDDIEGQEDETIREDDGIKVTPFNLKEEMEEGIIIHNLGSSVYLFFQYISFLSNSKRNTVDSLSTIRRTP